MKGQPGYEAGKVSVIIPAYNRGSLLAQTLDSVMAQSFANWECVIVDDGSTDATFIVASDYAEADERIRVFRRPEGMPKGGNTCRNFGFSASAGEYIQWFDSDDIMMPTMLADVVAAFEKQGSDIVVSTAFYFEEHPSSPSGVREVARPGNADLAFHFFAQGGWFQTSQATIRRTLIEAEGNLFSQQIRRNQETEYFVRLLLNGPKLTYLDHFLVAIRRHAESIGGRFNSLSEHDKLRLDIPAYQSMYGAFRKFNALTEESEEYFKDYFYRCLKGLEPGGDMFKLMVFGYRHGIFKPFGKASKLFLHRVMKNYGII